MELLTYLAYLIGPAFAIVQLLISVYAQKKRRNRGSNLMVAGSLLALLHACANSFLAIFLLVSPTERIDHDYYTKIMPYVSVMSILAGLLFLGGLMLFIQALATPNEDWKVLDRG